MKKGYIVMMIIGIVAVGVIVAFAVNSLNNNKTISMLEKYDMTQTDLDYLKNISKGIEDKINKENIDVPIDICYSKSNYLVVRGFKANKNNSNKGTEPMDISAPKRMYIVISKDETKVYNEDDSLELLGTAGSYYGKLFKTSNQYLVQFSSLDELLELVK